MNPVLSREIRQRFRRGRAPLFFTLWLVAVAVFSYLIYLAGLSYARSVGFFGIGSLASAGALGRTMFELTTFLLITAVLFVVPGVMALSVIGEKERLTFKLLQISQLRPWQIIVGKLGSGLAYTLLLVFAAGPMLLLPLVVGGVRLGETLAAFGMIVLTAVVIGSISLWVSARAKTTRGAVAGSYTWSFFLGVGTLIVLLAEVLMLRPSSVDTWGPDGRELYSAWLNPYMAVVSAVDEPIEEQGGLIFPTPFRSVDEILIRRQGGESFVRFQDTVEEFGFGGGGAFFGEGNQDLDVNRGPLWIRSVLTYLTVVGLMIFMAARTITAPKPLPLVRGRHRARAGPDA